MSRPNPIALALLSLALFSPCRATASAEFKADRDFLSSVLAKLPPTPFEQTGRYRGTVDTFRLVAIVPKARQIVLSCKVAGEFDEGAVMAGLTKSDKPLPPRDAKPSWKAFRFDVQVAVNIEPGLDGAPRFRFEVDEVKRRQLDGVAGGFAKLMGRTFDAIVTSYADKKATSLNDKLNAEVVKKIALFKDYGLLCGVDYLPTQIVLLFDQTRLRSEGIAGHVYVTAAPGTVPLFRWASLKDGTHYYTIDPIPLDPRVFKSEGIACFVFPGPTTGAIPLYRYRGKLECYYSPTRAVDLLRRVGYRLEGVACYLFAEPKPDTVPFYQFVDPRRGVHFYTTHPHAEFAK